MLYDFNNMNWKEYFSIYKALPPAICGYGSMLLLHHHWTLNPIKNGFVFSRIFHTQCSKFISHHIEKLEIKFILLLVESVLQVPFFYELSGYICLSSLPLFASIFCVLSLKAKSFCMIFVNTRMIADQENKMFEHDFLSFPDVNAILMQKLEMWIYV